VNRFPNTITWAIFAVAAFGLIAAISGDFRPQPVYSNLRVDPENPPAPEGFLHHEWVEIDFKAPGRNLNGFYFVGLLHSEKPEVDIRVENLSQQLLVYEGVIRDRATSADFEGANEVGDEMRLAFRWAFEPAPSILSREGTPLFKVSTEKKIPLDSDIENLDAIELKPDEPFVATFEAAEADLRAIVFPGMQRGEKSRVSLRIFNETRDIELRSTKWARDDRLEKVWTPNNAVGDRIRLELTWLPLTKTPNLQQAEVFPADSEMKIRVGGEETDFRPVFLVQYAWPTRALQWLWPLGLITFGIAFWKPRRSTVIVFLVMTGLLCTITSLMFWQQRLGLASAHTDPDRYGRYGQFLHDYVFEADKRDEILANPEFLDYQHAYAAGVPAILAGLYGVFSPQVAYAGLVAVCGFGVLLLLGHIGRNVFDLSDRQLLAGFGILASHIVFLKAFARPSTDLPGLLTVVAMIALLIWRMREAQPRQLWISALLGIALVFVRPSGPFCLLFFGIAFVVVDCVREKRLEPLKRIATGFAVAGPATALFAALFFFFGWSHNLEEAFVKKSEFYFGTTLTDFLVCLPALLNILPVLWIFARFRGPLERKSAWIIVAWIGFYIVMIIATRAPFLTRLFLPLVPFFVIFALVGIREIRCGWRRGLAYALIGATAAANIAITIWLTTLPNLPPAPFARFIY
jgi:hypothetical protein